MVDAGDSCTSCIPVVDGYVLGGALRSLPVAGGDVTRHVQKLLRCGRQGMRMALLAAVARQATQIACHCVPAATLASRTALEERFQLLHHSILWAICLHSSWSIVYATQGGEQYIAGRRCTLCSLSVDLVAQSE